MAVEFDLLGDPIPANHGKPGANGHTATAENAKKIRLLLVAGFTLADIAQQLNLSVPTLRKHYFQNGKVNQRQARARAIAHERGRNLLLLDAEASKGNVSAMKEIRKVIGDAAMDLMDQTARDRGKGSGRSSDAPAAQKAPPAPRPGQKVQARVAAHDAEGRLEKLWSEGLPN